MNGGRENVGDGEQVVIEHGREGTFRRESLREARAFFRDCKIDNDARFTFARLFDFTIWQILQNHGLSIKREQAKTEPLLSFTLYDSLLRSCW